MIHLNSIREERKRIFEKTIVKYGITKSNLLPMVLMAKEFAYLRTWRTDLIYRSGFRARNLFYEAAKRAKLPKEDVVYLTYQEVRKMLGTKKSPITKTELAERKKQFATFYDGKSIRVLAGQRWVNEINRIFDRSKQTVKEITGNVAFPGKVKGRAVLVFSSSDVVKCKAGDVLVSVMTFPNFIPAMEKAAAFVTDEGGILCHAAIVSREMKKPCIIATKIATKVFKDGDLVEVDANNGVVRKV